MSVHREDDDGNAVVIWSDYFFDTAAFDLLGGLEVARGHYNVKNSCQS